MTVISVTAEEGDESYSLEVEARKPFPAKFHRDGKDVITGRWNGDFVEMDPTTNEPYPHAVMVWPVRLYDLLERMLKGKLRERYAGKTA